MRAERLLSASRTLASRAGLAVLGLGWAACLEVPPMPEWIVPDAATAADLLGDPGGHGEVAALEVTADAGGLPDAATQADPGVARDEGAGSDVADVGEPGSETAAGDVLADAPGDASDVAAEDAGPDAPPDASSDGPDASCGLGDPTVSPGLPELCDGKDNDCDGATDEPLTAPPADKTAGVCAGQVKACGGSAGWLEPSYAAISGYQGIESTCDGQDNDCDGLTDETCPCGLLGVPCPDGFTCDTASAQGTSYPGFCVSLTGHEVWVPAGTFWMGCNPAADPYCYPGEFDTPQHEVTLGAFAIDRTEATAAAYKVCVDAGWCAAPVGSGKLSTYGIPGREAHPVNEVTWAMAEHYCAWSGKAVGAQRLPTEAEWEMAARGSCETLVGDCALGMRTYPWGEAAPSCQLAVINPTTDIFNTANWGCLTGQTWPVGSKPAGASPYGGLDLSGNVAEWVADWYAAYTGDPQIDPQGPAVGSDRAHRGGHLAIGGWRVSWRQYLGAEKSGGTIGFRCARDF